MKAMLHAAALAVGAAALALPATPVHAAAPPISLAAAKGAMLSSAEALSLGVPSRHQHEFTYVHGAKPHDDIWLCDLESEETEVDVAGARHFYGTEFLSADMPERQADQEIQAYGGVKRATETFDRVKKKARLCSGTFTRTDGPYTITVKLSNGRGVTSDGQPYVWVLSRTTVSDAKTTWADNDYTVIQRSGRFVQALSADSEGEGAKPISLKQRKRVDTLGPQLLARWVSAAG